MSDVALLNTIDSMLSTNDKATKLLWLKLASAKEEASKLSSLVADDDSMVNHGDIELTNTFKSEFMRLCWEAESDYSIKAMEAKKKAQQIAKQLQNDLLKSINLLTELQEKNALLISERMKLEQLVASLRTNVSHERQLRTRLDESRQALKQQLQDMELAVEHEKEQVQNLVANCNNLKRDGEQAAEQCCRDQQMLAELHNKYQLLRQEKVQSDAVIRTLESDNLHLVNSIETLESQYSSLNGQLDELRETNVDEMKTMKLLLSDKDKEMKLMIEKSYHEAEELRRKLDLQQSDSQRILQEKLALADKLSEMLSLAERKKCSLEAELSQLKVEFESVRAAKQQLEQQNKQISDELHTTRQLQQNLEKSLNEMSQQAGRLFCDNEHLHATVTQCQTQLQNNYTKLHAELSARESVVQHLKTQLQQITSSAKHHEAELECALKSSQQIMSAAKQREAELEHALQSRDAALTAEVTRLQDELMQASQRESKHSEEFSKLKEKAELCEQLQQTTMKLQQQLQQQKVVTAQQLQQTTAKLQQQMSDLQQQLQQQKDASTMQLQQTTRKLQQQVSDLQLQLRQQKDISAQQLKQTTAKLHQQLQQQKDISAQQLQHTTAKLKQLRQQLQQQKDASAEQLQQTTTKLQQQVYDLQQQLQQQKDISTQQLQQSTMKLTQLQQLLQRQKDPSSVLETENAQLKICSHEQKQIVGAADRQTVSVAEETLESEVDSEMMSLSLQLFYEKTRRLAAEKKLKRFERSSLRHVEELARELDAVRSQSLL